MLPRPLKPRSRPNPFVRCRRDSLFGGDGFANQRCVPLPRAPPREGLNGAPCRLAHLLSYLGIAQCREGGGEGRSVALDDETALTRANKVYHAVQWRTHDRETSRGSL